MLEEQKAAHPELFVAQSFSTTAKPFVWLVREIVFIFTAVSTTCSIHLRLQSQSCVCVCTCVSTSTAPSNLRQRLPPRRLGRQGEDNNNGGEDAR